jgi:hypothetical protein
MMPAVHIRYRFWLYAAILAYETSRAPFAVAKALQQLSAVCLARVVKVAR